MSCKHNGQYSDNHSHLCSCVDSCLSTSTLSCLPLPQHPCGECPTMLPSLILTRSQPYTYTTHSPQLSHINHHSMHSKSHTVSHLVFKSSVARLFKDQQLDLNCSCSCIDLGEKQRLVKDQLQLVSTETGLCRVRGKNRGV